MLSANFSLAALSSILPTTHALLLACYTSALTLVRIDVAAVLIIQSILTSLPDRQHFALHSLLGMTS